MDLKNKSIPLEREEQMALMKWISLQPKLRDYVLSIPNDAKRTPQTGRLMKLCGLLPGASDIFIAYPVPPYHGLFIELKRREKGRVTPEQILFQERMSKVGYKCAICYGWDSARELIESYTKGGSHLILPDLAS